MTRTTILIVSIAALLEASVAQAQRADTTRARVTYVSGNSVYIDAGAAAGLTVDDSLELRRGGRPIGRARVMYLTSTRAQAEIIRADSMPVEGDSVRLVRLATRESVSRDTAAAIPAPAPAEITVRPRRAALRGRIGARYFSMTQRDSSAASWQQPSTDIRLDGPLPGSDRLSVSLDARGRHTRRVTTAGIVGEPSTSTSVYQASLAWQTSSTQIRVGRQFADALADVSLFDGVLAQRPGARFDLGAFAGTQPDVPSMSFSTRVREYGAYVAAHATSDAGAAWSTSAGAIGSYDAGQLDREFVFLSGSWTGSIISAYGTQEVDYNRGWKRALGSPTFSPTSTLAMLSARLTPDVSLQAGYDTRRNVRLYRDYVTPEIAFDDAFRSGVWSGVAVGGGRRVNASADFRRSYGGIAGSADVVSLGAGATAAPLLPLHVRLRSSHFQSTAASGWLHSASLTADVTDGLQMNIGGGLRTNRQRTPVDSTFAATSRSSWYEAGIDWAVMRSWLVMLSLTRETGGWDANDQVFVALTYRF